MSDTKLSANEKRKATRERNKQLEAEKVIADRRKRDLEEALFETSYWIKTEPAYKFNVGDRVSIGNIEKSIVKEVHGDGRVYVLTQTYMKNNYGDHHECHREMVVKWIDIKPYQTPEDLAQIEIFTAPKGIEMVHLNTSISTLINHKYKWGMNLDPEYQRELVWDEVDKIALIDSIFNHIDIGKFTTIRLRYIKRETYNYEILDGKQRLCAIMEFQEGGFKYKGKFFHELHPMDRRQIRDYPILLAEISEPLTQKQKYDYFLKLNTTGKPQSKEHLNKVRDLSKSVTD